MSSHSNSTEAHNFYYMGVDNGACRRYAGCSLHYDGMTAISYSTAVARVIPAKGFREKDVKTANSNSGITLLSYDSMTSTTGRHVSELFSASPFHVIRVPFSYGRDDVSPERVRDNLLNSLENYSAHLNHVKERKAFHDLMDARSMLLKFAASEWAKPLMDRRFRKYEEIDADLEAWAKQFKKKLEDRRRREEQAAKRLVDRYMKAAKTPEGYLRLVRNVFQYGDSELGRDARATLREALSVNHASYAWVWGDEVVTSQHVHVPLAEAKVAMRAWAAGEDMRAKKVGAYSVVSYEGDVIQIGCHRIPRKNMLALYEVVMGKKFPERRAA